MAEVLFIDAETVREHRRPYRTGGVAGLEVLNYEGSDPALSWPDREVVHLEAEKITSEAMITLFETLAARHPTVSAIKIVLDNASYNHSAAVKAYLAREDCRIQLVFLPPYAPNLNLIERLWWLLKKTKLWNEHYPTFAGFKAAIDGFFRDIGSYREQLTSLITGHFRFIGAPKSQPP